VTSLQTRVVWPLALLGGGAFLVALALEVTDQPVRRELVVAVFAGLALLVASAPAADPLHRSWLLAGAAGAFVLSVAADRRVQASPITALLYVPAIGLLVLAVVGIRDAARHRRAVEHARIEGIERERRRWARELHDETLQELGALQVLLGMAATTADAEHTRRLTAQAGHLVSHQISALRDLISDLHPVVLDQFGLAPAIEALCRRARAGAGTTQVLSLIDLPEDEGGRPVRFDAEIEVSVYRVMQEALANALRHADAGRITVTVRSAGGRITAEVVDDGRGMESQTRVPGRAVGLGLPGMRERAALVGGMLRTDAAPGGGTRVTLSVPARGRATERDRLPDRFTHNAERPRG
jgi:signal transduction histidine kinase